MKPFLLFFIFQISCWIFGYAQKFNRFPIKGRPYGYSNLIEFLNPQKWNKLFPNRYGYSRYGPNSIDSGKKDFYTFRSFLLAAKRFPRFLDEPSDSLRRRELAAFLAQISQETSGGWTGAPGGLFSWGLYFKAEQGCSGGCPQYSIWSNHEFPPMPGRSYKGRGPLQLSYNYQYGTFSRAWFGTKDSLLLHPELLSRDPVLAFASAIWFWMTSTGNKPSCHSVIDGKWKPTRNDLFRGRVPGFGMTINIINGGEECGKAPSKTTLHRYAYYQYFCKKFRVNPGKNLECTYQHPYSLAG